MKETPVSYHRILDRLERREARLLNSRGFHPLAGVGQAAEARIPPALRDTLQTAFQKAFSTLFGPNGTTFLEHTFAKGRLEKKQGIWDEGPAPGQAKKELRRLARQRRNARAAEVCVSGVEGTALGLLGVGLPDIPVMLGILLRSLYEAAATYGFSCDTPEERVYLLLLLQGGVTKGDTRRAISRRADQLGRALDHGWPTDCCLEQEMERTANLLAERLLFLKFIQGIPVVGAIGGAGNLSMSYTVSKYGSMKYQKRFLEKKVRGL